MLPLVLDVQRRKVVVVGRGHAAQARYEYARDAGAQNLSLYVIDQDGWACHAEAALYERLPVRADLAGASLVLIAGLEAAETERLARIAREAGALVNAEDVSDLCDFHVPAIVRRGDLVLTASTGGKAPGFSKRIGAYLHERFGTEWGERTRRLVEARKRWRSEGRTKAEIARLTNQLVDKEGWLKEREPA